MKKHLVPVYQYICPILKIQILFQSIINQNAIAIVVYHVSAHLHTLMQMKQNGGYLT